MSQTIPSSLNLFATKPVCITRLKPSFLLHHIHTHLSSSNCPSLLLQRREIIKGSVWELQEGLLTNNSPGPACESWKAFTDEPEVQPLSGNNQPRSVRTLNGHQKNKKAPVNSSADDKWGFSQDAFTAIPASSQMSLSSGRGSNSQQFSHQKSVENKQKSTQPAGWAGF